jgi:hypothetical protein
MRLVCERHQLCRLIRSVYPFDPRFFQVLGRRFFAAAFLGCGGVASIRRTVASKRTLGWERSLVLGEGFGITAENPQKHLLWLVPDADVRGVGLVVTQWAWVEVFLDQFIWKLLGVGAPTWPYRNTKPVGGGQSRDGRRPDAGADRLSASKPRPFSAAKARIV